MSSGPARALPPPENFRTSPSPPPIRSISAVREHTCRKRSNTTPAMSSGPARALPPPENFRTSPSPPPIRSKPACASTSAENVAIPRQAGVPGLPGPCLQPDSSSSAVLKLEAKKYSAELLPQSVQSITGGGAGGLIPFLSVWIKINLLAIRKNKCQPAASQRGDLDQIPG